MSEQSQLPPILQAFGADLARTMDAIERRQTGRGEGLQSWARGLRVPIILLACLAAAGTIALAAGGLLPTGGSVRPEEALRATAGEGLPVRGASRLLGLRVADPEGGLPWGMRVVHTTRGEVCIQVGRVQNGQLGEIGVDGAFHDDGLFHPIPADALPIDSFHGHFFDPSWGIANANTTCQLAGQVNASDHIGLDRNAEANQSLAKRPLGDLRDIDYGLLGRQAVSVTYRAGGSEVIVPVVPGVGAFLIVRASAAHEQIGSGGGSLGSEGDLAPVAPLTAITYRLAGRLCERGPSLAPGARANLPDPCPQPHFARTPPREVDLHEPIGVQLERRGGRVLATYLSFRAPYAVTGARDEYVIVIPAGACPGSEAARLRAAGATGGAQVAIGHNVARGELVRQRIAAGGLFITVCARPDAEGGMQHSELPRSSATVEVRYTRPGGPSVLVGRAVVQLPANTLAGSPRGR